MEVAVSISNAAEDKNFKKNTRIFGIDDYDLDDFSETSLKVFEIQESVLCHKKYYYLLSFVSIILLDLNIITVRSN